jgi:NifU-like protein involved in Fe-S cluster formation
MSNGDLWVSNNLQDTPAGVITATYKISSDCKFQKIGTLSGTFSSSLAATNATGKTGREIT